MGTFKIKKTASDKYMFDLVARNGEIVGSSQQYASLESCKGGIESVRKNAGSHIEDQTKAEPEKLSCPKWEVYTDKGGEHIRFRLKAANGEDIIASQASSAKSSAIEGIESIRRNADDSAVEIEDDK